MSFADALRTYVAKHRMTFELLEPKGEPAVLVERLSGKRLTFDPRAIVALEEATDNMKGGKYVRLALDDGRSFALAGIGLVFAPSFVNTGPLEDCPPTACFVDFEKIYGHLEHLVTEEDRGREALQTVMVLIAYLDGARAIGLDVGEDERRVNAQLEVLEARGKP